MPSRAAFGARTPDDLRALADADRLIAEARWLVDTELATAWSPAGDAPPHGYLRANPTVTCRPTPRLPAG